MTNEEALEKDKELIKKFGFIASWDENSKDRIHMIGLEPASGPLVKIQTTVEGDLYLVIYLDPMSPIGEFLGRWLIPFRPDKDFHFDKCTLWIYQIDDNNARAEIRFKSRREALEIDYEIIYGIQISANNRFTNPHDRFPHLYPAD